MKTDAQLVAELETASRGIAPPKTDDELVRGLQEIAKSAGIQLRTSQPARRATEQDASHALRAEAAKVRLERAAAEAAMNGADERIWEARRAEGRAEKARQAAEQLRKDAEADRQFARKEKEAAQAALKEAREIAGEAGSTEEARRQVAERAKTLEAEKARLEKLESAVEELTHRLREESERIDGVLGTQLGTALRLDPGRLKKMVEGKLDAEKEAIGEILVRLHRIWMGEALTPDEALTLRRTVGGGVWAQ